MSSVSILIAALAFAVQARFFYAGGDPSEIPEVEARGGVYKVSGHPVDPLVAMKQAGWTAVRLRVWNAPTEGFCDKAHTLALAKRVHAAGLRLMIDFHYSDWWADPGKQNKPAAWASLTVPQLEKAVHDYTYDVVKSLADQGTPADVVQPGNEVTNGMLWPDGRIHVNTDGWNSFMALTKAAIAAIREAGGAHPPKIMIHIDQGGNNSVTRYWFDNYFSRGGECDLIGLSYYPMWHGTLEQLRANLAFIAKTYKKDVMVAETAFPSSGWNEQTRRVDPDATPVPGIKSSPEGQAIFLKRLLDVVKATPGGHGVGVLWWAPAWIGSRGAGGGWSRYTLFNGETGEALPGLFTLGGKKE
jgi:arabinogalactan endo-1,4-beta-galactosidase